MAEKGCDNCYYEYFDSRAYPCSLCIRGIKRTDKWMPSKKTKAEIQQVVRLKHFKCPKCGRSDYIRSFEDWGIDGGIYKYKCINCNTYIKDEPQTERNIGVWHRKRNGNHECPFCDYEVENTPFYCENCGAWLKGMDDKEADKSARQKGGSK